MFRNPFVPSLLGLSLMSLFFIPLPIAKADSPNAPITTTLPNGMRILCRQETDTPLISINVFIRVGAQQENSDNAGISSFVARTLLASTINNTPEQMTTDVEALGGSVVVTRQPDWTQLTALIVKDQFDDAAFLVTNALKNADFDPNAVEIARQQILDEIDNSVTDPFATAYQGVRQRLYAGDTYALPALGTSYTVKHLTRGELQRFYNRYYVPSNFVIVVVGNISPDEATQKISEDLDPFPLLGRGTRTRAPELTSPALPSHDFAPIHASQIDQTQVCVMAGFQAPPMSSADYPALQVANALLGGMKSSRMFTTLREKQGLAYELGSFYNAQIGTGEIVGYIFAAASSSGRKSPSSISVIRTALLSQFDSFKTAPPTPADLARAQHFIIGTYKIKHERLEDRSALLGVAAIATKSGAAFDQDYASYINAVTAADVQRVAQKYFVHPVISVVEPDSKDGGIQDD